jgi:hypothetical protein
MMIQFFGSSSVDLSGNSLCGTLSLSAIRLAVSVSILVYILCRKRFNFVLYVVTLALIERKV